MQARNVVDKACVGIMIVSKVYLKLELGLSRIRAINNTISLEDTSSSDSC